MQVNQAAQEPSDPLSQRGAGRQARTQIAAKAARSAVTAALRFYKRWISPMLPSACRYYPTCSQYMLQAVEKYGAARGICMGIMRLARCHPFHAGGFDPVK
ncbi:MAG TPA: membrane protein insertion efficiency factor YidD [Bryobacteraceae bacterium]|jgi:putative membrane protein insertion efficiency factor|nr:membrane protein insertion efficiency factor YidD [Bryobacteraceae bacterium]